MGSISSEVLCSIRKLENCTELTQLDRRTRRLMRMPNVLHPKSKFERLYILRKYSGKGLEGVEEAVKLENVGLEN